MAGFFCLQEDEDLAGHLRDGGGRGARLRRGGAHHVWPARAHQLPAGRRRRRCRAPPGRVVVPLPLARRQTPPLQPRVRAGRAGARRQGRRRLRDVRPPGARRRAPAHRGGARWQRRHGDRALAVGGRGWGLERRVPRGAVRGPDDRGAAGLQLLHGDLLLAAPHAASVAPLPRLLCSASSLCLASSASE
jgi:hypothetical protein